MVNLADSIEFVKIHGLLLTNLTYLRWIELLTLANHFGNLVLKWNGHYISDF